MWMDIKTTIKGCIVIICIGLCSCNTLTNNEIIPEMKNIVSNRGEEFTVINKWLLSNCRSVINKCGVYIDRNSNKSRIKYDCTDKEIENKYINNVIVDLLRSEGFVKILLAESNIYYEYLIRNKDLKNFKLVYVENLKAKRLTNLKVYKNGDIPEEVSGWLYNLIDNWYLLSPLSREEVKKNKLKKDIYFRNFNEDFKGEIIEYNKYKIPSSQCNGQILIKLKLSGSSITYYDPRDSLELYCCVIDFPYAELIVTEDFGILKDNIGSYSYYNGRRDMLFVRKKNHPNDVNCYVNYSKLYNDEMEEYFTIPKYTEEERRVKLESNNYKRDNRGVCYRVLIGKYSNTRELTVLKNKCKSSKLIKDGFEKESNIVVNMNSASYLFNNIRFFNKSHIIKELKRHKSLNLQIGVFDKDDNCIEVYVSPGVNL